MSREGSPLPDLPLVSPPLLVRETPPLQRRNAVLNVGRELIYDEELKEAVVQGKALSALFRAKATTVYAERAMTASTTFNQMAVACQEATRRVKDFFTACRGASSRLAKATVQLFRLAECAFQLSKACAAEEAVTAVAIFRIMYEELESGVLSNAAWPDDMDVFLTACVPTLTTTLLGADPCFLGVCHDAEYLRESFMWIAAEDTHMPLLLASPAAQCCFCQEPFAEDTGETYIRIVNSCRRPMWCQQEDIGQDNPCEGHACGCVDGVFHLRCMAQHVSQPPAPGDNGKSYSKCPTCNAHFCARDLVVCRIALPPSAPAEGDTTRGGGEPLAKRPCPSPTV